MNLLNFDIKSSWECENAKNLPSAIKTVEVFPENIFDSLSEDQCISFKQPIESPDCTIIIKLIESNSNDLSTRLDNFEYEEKQTSDICTNGITDHHSVLNSNTDINPVSCYLDKMVILSEARFIELYCAEYSEYIATAHGSLLSEFDDSKIYQTTLTFNKLEKSVVLKPKGLFCADSLWIYGIFLKVKRVSGKTNIENGVGNPLETILKEKNVVLSEKAEKFKKLLNVYKSFQSTSTYQPFIDPFSAASVFSNIHWAYSNQTEDKNFKFLPPKSILNNTSTLPKEEETYLKSNSHEGGTMEKFLGKMQQLLLEESDLKTVNSSNFIKFLSRNGNSSAVNNEHLSNSTEATDNFSHDSYLQVNGNNSDNQIAKSQPLSEDTISLINSIIDKKLKEFEENIVNKLETKIVEINRTIIERLDRIESKLS